MAFTVQHGGGAMLQAIAADQRYRNFLRERDFAFDRERYDTQLALQERDRRARDMAQLSSILESRRRARDSGGPSDLEMFHDRTKARVAETQARYDATRSDRGFVDPDGGAYSNQHVLPDGRVLSGPQAAASDEYQQYKQDKRIALIEGDDSLSGAEKQVARQMVRQRQILESAQEDNRPPAAKKMELRERYDSQTLTLDDGSIVMEDPKTGTWKVLKDAPKEERDQQRSMSPSEFLRMKQTVSNAAFDAGIDDPVVIQQMEQQAIQDYHDYTDQYSQGDQIEALEAENKALEAQQKNQELKMRMVESSEGKPIMEFFNDDAKVGRQEAQSAVQGVQATPAPGDLLGEYSAPPAIDPANANPEQANIPQNQPAVNPFDNSAFNNGIPGSPVVDAEGHPVLNQPNQMPFMDTLDNNIVGDTPLAVIGIGVDGEPVTGVAAGVNVPMPDKKVTTEADLFENDVVRAQYLMEKKRAGEDFTVHQHGALKDKWVAKDRAYSNNVTTPQRNEVHGEFIKTAAKSFIPLNKESNALYAEGAEMVRDWTGGKVAEFKSKGKRKAGEFELLAKYGANMIGRKVSEFEDMFLQAIKEIHLNPVTGIYDIEPAPQQTPQEILFN